MNTDVHTLSGAYAIDALSGDEGDLFRTHLDACPACWQEVSELQAAAAQMGSAEALAPPPDLKARIIASVEQQPQMPPRVRHLNRGSGRRPRIWFPRLMAAAAAAVLIAAAGVGYLQIRDDATPGSTLAAGVVRVFEAPDAHHATVKTANGGKVSVATSPSLNRMAVDTDELPALKDGQVYQLWAVADGTFASAGLLEHPDRGAAMAMPAEGVKVAITIEPAGGSVKPSTAPIISVTPSEV
ncbi:MAG: anti-sigma factor [Sporichthyaceae bacterium]